MGLVLSRKEGESVKIGHNLTVQIKEIGTGRVRLYIDAPPDVKIVRTELLPPPPALAKTPAVA